MRKHCKAIIKYSFKKQGDAECFDVFSQKGKIEKIREWAEKRRGLRDKKNTGLTDWWLATANGPQAISRLHNHSVCVSASVHL